MTFHVIPTTTIKQSTTTNSKNLKTSPSFLLLRQREIERETETNVFILISELQNRIVTSLVVGSFK